MFIVYSKPACPNCELLKRYLKSNNIEFEVKDISVDTEAFDKIVSAGFNSVPVLEIDGQLQSGTSFIK